MCRLFGMTGGPDAVTATFWLVEAQDSLARQSRRNPDGTGLGWFGDNGRPCRLRDTAPAWKDPRFTLDAREVRSRTFIAHVRLASTGGLQERNTHPFLMDDCLLAHNGHIGDLPTLERRLGDALGRVEGQTDSERFMALVVDEAERRHDLEGGLVAAACWVAAELPLYALNVVIATATHLWALRYPDTHELWVLERRAEHGRHLDAASAAGTVRVRSRDLAHRPAVIVASEPMDESPHWRPLKPGELVRVGPDLTVDGRIILPDPPRHRLGLEDLDSRAAESQSHG